MKRERKSRRSVLVPLEGSIHINNTSIFFLACTWWCVAKEKESDESINLWMFILTCSQRNNTEIKALPVFQGYPGISWRTPPCPLHLTHPPGQRWAAVVPPHFSNPPRTWIWHLGGQFPQEAAKRCLLSHLSKWTWGESRMAHSETCRIGVQAPRVQRPGRSNGCKEPIVSF